MKALVFGRYATQDAAREVFRSIRDRWYKKADLSGDDEETMLHALSYHNSYAVKCGVGIAGLFVAEPPDMPLAPRQRCGFWVRRLDGTVIDFSWNECIKGTSADGKMFKAARHAVQAQCDAFRASVTQACVTCGCTSRLHVDHVYPLSEMVKAWRQGRPTIVMCTEDVARCGDRFLDADASSWSDYHREHARFQMLCISCNARKGAKK